MKSALTFLLLLSVVFATFGKSYDFIITGGGAPGAILAYRLSENPNTKVLLLERGPDNCNVFNTTVGFYGAFSTVPPQQIPDVFQKSIYDRHMETREIDTVNRYVPLPTMLGGGALRNGNAFGRMSEEEMAGFNSPLWTFDATTEDWKRLISYQQCNTGPCDTNAHGTTGPLKSNTFEPDTWLSLIKGAYQNIFDLPWLNDTNAGNNAGLGLMHRNIKVVDGVPFRQEPYCNLLKSAVAERPNLTILSQALVTKIDIRNNGKHKVNYIYQGNFYEDKAREEVLVAAGAIDSVQLLKLSGVGPCDELTKFDIECLYANDHLGENLMDNPTIGLTYLTPPPTTPSLGSIIVGYTKSDPNAQFNEFEVAATTFKVGGVIDGVLAYVSDMDHGGVGSVRLRTANPLDQPIVSTNFYTYLPSRISRMVEKVKQTRAVFKFLNENVAPVFHAASPSEERLPADATDAQIEAYLRSSDGIAASWHWTGSTSMHKVVDERLRLIDNNGDIIPGIRVVGNGVSPNNLKSHSTSSFSMHVGEIAARLIKEDHEI